MHYSVKRYACSICDASFHKRKEVICHANKTHQPEESKALNIIDNNAEHWPKVAALADTCFDFINWNYYGFCYGFIMVKVVHNILRYGRWWTVLKGLAGSLCEWAKRDSGLMNDIFPIYFCITVLLSSNSHPLPFFPWNDVFILSSFTFPRRVFRLFRRGFCFYHVCKCAEQKLKLLLSVILYILIPFWIIWKESKHIHPQGLST